MLDAITKPELITGIVVIIGAAAGAASKFGWIRFGKGGEESSGCPSPKCHESMELRLAQIEEAREDIADLKRTLSKEVFPAIHATAHAVSRIEGRLDEIAKRG